MGHHVEISLSVSVFGVARFEGIGENDFPDCCVMKRPDFPFANPRSPALTGGKKGLTFATRDVSLEAGVASLLFSSIVRRNLSSPSPRKRVVSSTISLARAGSYWRLAEGIDGGAEKLPQKDWRLHAKSEGKETRILALAEAEARTLNDHR
jgi:hypothetical protein